MLSLISDFLFNLKEYIHPEILASIAMAIPGITSIYFLFIVENNRITNPFGIQLSAISCLCHFPWSASLHIHRAYGKDIVIRGYIYKADVLFQHVYSLCTRYAFVSQISIIEILFHISCVLHLLVCNLLKNPERKKTISILSAIGLGSCLFNLYNNSFMHFYVATGCAWIGFVIHQYEVLGRYSPFWFHICLSIPHYCILMSISRSVAIGLQNN